MPPSRKNKALLTCAVAASVASAAVQCPPIAHFPPAQLLGQPKDHPTLGTYLKKLTDHFNAFSSNSTLAGYNTTHTSFSIQITHPNHPHNKPVWEYSYTATNTDPRGTKKVTPDSQFRVASVSKLVTMVGVVKAGLGLEDSIVKYIPELKGSRKGGKTWEEITIKSLGSHLAGVQRDFGYTEVAMWDLQAKIPGISDILQGSGLPIIPIDEFPPCEFPPYFPQACTREQFLNIVASQPPVVPPFSQPIYSNSAFKLLALAVENKTGVPFPEYMRKNVFDPLNMTATIFSPAKGQIDNSKASIPPGKFATFWDLDFGSNDPGGGLYSSAADISKILLSLLPSTLNNAPILTPHPTAAFKFLNPAAFVQGTNTHSVGTPWEIFRPQANNGAVTIYTKSGGIDGFTAEAVLIPEYDIAISIVSSGDSIAIKLLDIVLKYIDDGKEQGILVGGFGGAGRLEQKEQYDGVYIADKESGINSTIKLSTAADVSGGLIIDKWISNGTDFLNVTSRFRPYPIDARLFPVDLFGPGDTKYQGGILRKEEWKLLLLEKKQKPSEPGKDQPKISSYLDGTCEMFYGVDFARFGGEPVDRVVMWRLFEGNNTTRMKGPGKIVGIEFPFLRVALKKD